MATARSQWWILALIFGLVGARGLYWLLTPAAHPGVSNLRRAAVILQVVAGLLAMLITIRRARKA
jgi:hypothetical protein